MSKSIFSMETPFARFMTSLADILLIGILWLICCIPLVTAGVATSAAYYAMAKVVYYNEGYAVREFWNGIKKNIKQGISISVVTAVLNALLVIDLIYVWGNRSSLNDAVFVVLCMIAFLLLAFGIYFFPLLSRFAKRTRELALTALVLEFKYLYLSVVFVIGLGLGAYIMIVAPAFLIFIPGLLLWMMTYPMEWVMHKMMPVPEEGSEEADKWYYNTKIRNKKSKSEKER